MKKKVLLLNLPYKNKKFQRDLSCPHTSKADYYWPSIDLLAISGILSNQKISFIDGVIEKLTKGELIKKIRKINPEYIFTMISAISFEEDIKIIKEIKKYNKNIKICVTGDLCSFETSFVKKYSEIDFIISDFTEKEKIIGIIENKQKKRIISSSKNKEFKIGIPKHELIKKYDYYMPYSYYVPVSGIITNFGCPFKCKFCNSNNFKFKYRNVNEIIAELKYIKKVGIKEVYFRDFTFGIPNIKEILNEIIKSKIKIKWSCEFRADLAKPEILTMMKRAGCYLIFYGGESGNQSTLDKMNKGFRLEELEKAIKETKEAGIETLVSFIIGFNFEDIKEIEKTRQFIKKINPDYVSINIFVPRIGSDFRKEINSNERNNLDNSSELGIIYKNGMYALDYKKKIERNFFFKPAKMIKYLLLSLKSFKRFKRFIKSGSSIFLRTAKK